MLLFMLGLAGITLGGVLALALALLGREGAALRAGAASFVAGAAVALAPALGVLAGSPALRLDARWAVPGGALALSVDRLAALFLVTILALCSLAAVYGVGYLEHHRGKRPLGPAILFFHALAVIMCLVVTAANGVLFLVAWELMAVLAFLLVSFEDDDAEVRNAALTYLVVTHLSSSLVVAFFLMLGGACGSLDFAAIAAGPAPLGGRADLLFALALVGFGTKAGVWPFHIWLPVAHPAAPTHVSAVMSGVIVKVALYGLIRGVSLLGAPRPEWGLAILGAGAASAVLGVLYALAQHDLKRLLAYHTIENVGIILLGVGVGFLGVAHGRPDVAALGFAGGLLHVVNHALFKGLLFFGAGAVAQAAGTREIERLGGLLRAMPWTAGAFLVGAAAISGLPPLNGFVSEWLVYAGLVETAMGGSSGAALGAAGAVSALALVGGLAAACFAKAFGVVFLGAPRSEHGAGARECAPGMRAAMVGAALACAAIGLLPQVAAGVVLPIGAGLAGIAPAAAEGLLEARIAPAAAIGRAAAALLALAAAVAIGRRLLLAGRIVGAGQTWGCGYGATRPSMQYTASSFAAPLLELASGVLRPHVEARAPEGPFPGPASRATHTPDVADESVWRPAVRGVGAALHTVRFLQQGRLQLYLLYVLVTVIALLLWQTAGASS